MVLKSLFQIVFFMKEILCNVVVVLNIMIKLMINLTQILIE